MSQITATDLSRPARARMGDPDSGYLGEGVIVGDAYQLDKVIASGGMGSVWSARHIKLGHSVAIKFLRNWCGHSDETLHRFEQEARMTARLGQASLYIAQVIDYGVAPFGGAAGTPYLVMELLQGRPLSDFIRRNGPVKLTTVSLIVSQICSALSVTHANRIVHRDLKPSNIFLCDSGNDGRLHVKLIDFGIAKSTSSDETGGMTQTGAMIGTPGYMSPEQIRGSSVDGRSDLWSVAVIAYLMATGRSPFKQGNIQEVTARILWHDVEPPSQKIPELPESFDTWMKHGLSRNPTERFQSAEALATSLERVAKGEPWRPQFTESGTLLGISAAHAERSHPSSRNDASTVNFRATVADSPPVELDTVLTPGKFERKRPSILPAIGVAVAILSSSAFLLSRGSDEVKLPAGDSQAVSGPVDSTSTYAGRLQRPNKPQPMPEPGDTKEFNAADLDKLAIEPEGLPPPVAPPARKVSRTKAEPAASMPVPAPAPTPASVPALVVPFPAPAPFSQGDPDFTPPPLAEPGF